MRLLAYVPFSLGLIHKLLGSLYYLVHIHSCQIEKMPVFATKKNNKKKTGTVLRKIDDQNKTKNILPHMICEIFIYKIQQGFMVGSLS